MGVEAFLMKAVIRLERMVERIRAVIKRAGHMEEEKEIKLIEMYAKAELKDLY